MAEHDDAMTRATCARETRAHHLLLAAERFEQDRYPRHRNDHACPQRCAFTNVVRVESTRGAHTAHLRCVCKCSGLVWNDNRCRELGDAHACNDYVRTRFTGKGLVFERSSREQCKAFWRRPVAKDAIFSAVGADVEVPGPSWRYDIPVGATVTLSLARAASHRVSLRRFPSRSQLRPSAQMRRSHQTRSNAVKYRVVRAQYALHQHLPGVRRRVANAARQQ